VTATGPNVVVYVDGQGNPLYTSTEGGQAATSTPSPSIVTANVNKGKHRSKTSSTAAAAATTTVEAASTETPAASTVVVASSAAASSAAASSPAAYSSAATSNSGSASTSSSAPAASSSVPSSGSGSGMRGISYSPYSGNVASGNVGCKTAAQVAADFAEIDSSHYNMVRIYGTDCNQVENVLTVAKSKGMKVFAGVYDITQVASEIATIIAAANGDWSDFHTISIGNELVNSGAATVSAVTSAISTARGLLSAASYTGKIVTVDTFVAIKANPALCEASDYAAANAHPYFDGNVEAANAGPWVLSQMEAVSSACGGKDTMITETGWPWGGESFQDAVASPANQAAAVSSIQGSVSSNLIMFTAFNDMWKAPGYLNIEQSWGMLGNSASS